MNAEVLELNESSIWTMDIFKKAIRPLRELKTIIGGTFIVTELEELLSQTRYKFVNPTFYVFMPSSDRVVSLDAKTLPIFSGTVKMDFYDESASRRKIRSILNLDKNETGFSLSAYFSTLWGIKTLLQTNLNGEYFAPIDAGKISAVSSQEVRFEINKSLTHS